METKKCDNCGHVKGVDEFYKYSRKDKFGEVNLSYSTNCKYCLEGFYDETVKSLEGKTFRFISYIDGVCLFKSVLSLDFIGYYQVFQIEILMPKGVGIFHDYEIFDSLKQSNDIREIREYFTENTEDYHIIFQK